MPLTQCPACKSTISTQATQCPKCGHPMNGASNVNNNRPQYPQQPYNPTQPLPNQPKPFYPGPDVVDQPNTGLNVISFLWPVVGWILYFVYKENTPLKAKSCSKWAWISVGIQFAFIFICIIIGAIAGALE